MTQTTAALIWFAGLIGWYVIRYPFARRAKKTRISTSLYDRRESLLLAFATTGLFVIPVLYTVTGLPAALDRPFIAAIAWLGLVPLCASLWLFYRSHVDLGRYWSISLELRERHALVQTGAYRLIRHPMYTSFLLLGLSQLMLLPNWLAGLSGLLGAAAFLVFRMRREEHMMVQAIGDEYRAYMMKTKRLIPWIL
ncbi:MAG TPA: protein-S-isoprenylcysteine O-methyltransferase [Pseudolabrys sp.]|nr:protein-S-isoprenylcysteine O-methyltransferase [Pseudolabrys sp.]